MLTPDWDIWWDLYPRKVGKLDAEKAYTKARTHATAPELLDGLAWQVTQESWQREPQYIPYPATWLRAGRWLDARPAVKVKVDTTCPHTPACHNTTWCLVTRARERGEV